MSSRASLDAVARRTAWLRSRGIREAAGPLLIAASVLIVLAQFAFRGKVTVQHFDVLPLWLPNHCFLGTELRSGHIPAWNPFAMGGVPFAADPQSGWLYLPAMFLYSTLPCRVALGWFIAIQPIIAGLGLYAFLRSEGAVRPAAAVGGLSLALSTASSFTAISLPFSGAMAWTMVCLAAVSRVWRTTGWPRRLLWLLATAIVWGQLASAHMGQGLVVGTTAIAFYLGGRLIGDARRRRGRMRERLLVLLLIAVTLPLVNLAILLPRLEYIRASSLGFGYEGVRTADARLEGLPSPPPLTGNTGVMEPRWPLGLALTPGAAYMGVAALALASAGFWARRHRAVAVTFLAYGAACYLLGLRAVATALAPVARSIPFGDFYLHAPARLHYGVLLAVPVLAGLGADAWRDRRSLRHRVLMILPSVVVFAALPTLLGYRWGGQWIPLSGMLVGGSVLALSAKRPRFLPLVPLALSMELVAGGLAGQTGAVHLTPSTARFTLKELQPLTRPGIDVGAYLRPDQKVARERQPPIRDAPCCSGSRTPGPRTTPSS